MLAFDELEAEPDPADGDSHAVADTAVVRGLEQELASTRAELQAALEQQATVGEEMKSANEEYQSVNEELQSANEELETSKEEMQSINEELQTVNAEVQSKNDALNHLNSDLQNLLDSTQIATLFLDAQLHVRSFTPAVAEIYRLRGSDRGRPLTEIAARLQCPELRDDVAQVLRSLSVVERVLKNDDMQRTFLLRMRPYRTVDNVIDGVVMTFVDISERQKHEIERGRLAAIVDSSRDMIIGHALDGTITSWNASAERLLGFPAGQMLGKGLSCLASDSDDVPIRELLEACAQQRVSNGMEMRWKRADGSRVPVEVTSSPVRDGSGNVIAGSLVARDVSDRLRAEQAVRSSEWHLSQLIAQAAVGIAETDFQGRFLRVNPAYCELVERSAEALQQGMHKQDIIHPDDLPRYLQHLQALQASGRPFRMEKRYLRPDGSVVWVDNSVSVIAGADGIGDRVLAVLQDISERRNAAEHQKLLMGELNHRVKNTLASVQAIALQTLAGASGLDGFKTAFLARLHALSNTHNLLSGDAWSGVDLREIVLAELTPYRREGSSRATVTGAALKLEPKAALALGMTLHELATNAGKYGALSQPQGRVAVEWDTRVTDAQTWLQLQWTERGGPAVTPPTRRGFGTRLINEGLAFELGGEVTLAFEPEGVTCRIDVPLTREEPAP